MVYLIMIFLPNLLLIDLSFTDETFFFPRVIIFKSKGHGAKFFLLLPWPCSCKVGILFDLGILITSKHSILFDKVHTNGGDYTIGE
jgi:hypothetical protein